jgi:uncharacterized phage protein gp47/JayE
VRRDPFAGVALFCCPEGRPLTATLPQYLTSGQDQAAILARMKATIAGLDVSEGSFPHDMLAPSAIEMALAATWCQEVLRRAFTQTTDGGYLDLKADEIGLARLAATAATATVTLTGTNGTVVPQGTIVATVGTPGAPSVSFATDTAATIASGAASVGATAVVAGAAGDVAAGTIVLLAHPLGGIASLTNAAAATGGTDEEADAALLARILAVKRNPSTGGNKADYDRWALAVPGVGGVSTVPVRDGAGTVSVAVVDPNKVPATQTLVDAVQAAIAPPWLASKVATSLTTSGTGTSTDATAPGTTGAHNASVKKQVYDAASNTLYVPSTQTQMPSTKPGVYRWRVRAKVDSAVGAVAMYRIGVWNTTGSNWCATSPSGSLGASLLDRTGAQMPAAYGAKTSDWLTVLFYWNGTDAIEARAVRLGADTSRVVWVDEVQIDSTFSKDTGAGLAPIGHRVAVEAATAVTVNAAATLTIGSGYDVASVRAAVTAAVTSYLASIAFNPPGTTVFYAKVGAAIVNVPGVVSYASLLVNGAGADVAIGAQQVPVVGTLTWS